MTRFIKCYPFWNFICLGFHLISGEMILRANPNYVMSFEPLTLNCSTDAIPTNEMVTFYVDTVIFARIKYFPSTTKCFIERFENGQSIGGGECNDECDCQQGKSYIWSYNGTVNTNPMKFICVGGYASGAINGSVVVYQAVPVTSVTILPSDDTNITNVMEGKTMTFTCITDSSLPAAWIHWYIGGKNVTNLAQLQAPHPDQLKYISSSIFVYTGEIADHNKDIFCEAVNKEGSYKVTSQKKYIYVQIGPKGIHLSPVNYLYIVTETKSLNRVICAATCRPRCNYTWTGPNGFTEINSYLQLNSVYRNQTGLYFCHAKNEFGSKTSNHINIIVKYAPTILRLEALVNNIVGEHQSVTFECAVESYPAPVIKWIFPRTNTILNKDDNVFKSNYTITKTECLQTGPYRCQATNVIDAVFTNAFSETDLFVLCSVRKDQRFSQPTADIAIMENDELNITVFLLAYPKPLITWTLRNFETGIIYAVTFNNSFNIYEHSSTVYSNKISKTGYGVYTINAYNDIGLQYIQSFSVIEQGIYNSQSNNGMIMSVGAGVGSSIFVLLVAGLVVFFLKRRNYNTDDTSKLYQSTHHATRRHKTNDEQHSYNELQTIKPDSNQENVQTNSSFTYEEIGNIKDEGNYQNVSKDKKVSD